MSIFDTIVSALRALTGGGRAEEPTTEPGPTEPQDGRVAVEHDPDAAQPTPDAATEAAVKGGDAPTEATSGDTAAGESKDDAPTGSADDAEPTADGATASVETIKGIGPAYAGRLEEFGIETVSELAAADAVEVADGIDVSESRVSDWIGRASGGS
ncbi:hypothetical protein GCM10008995_08180 [Halobellus salinus]|uniref:Helix-hairpin-helix domain-containing protein n=1 Tax=Halobellus salinus TaxID=931585 RepID=A0A830EFR2_9EURY|nr:helix-hairpin-helix domain-containing protein [Halobellus salinus]GGJ00727.1 hypothetical protein GCM10008995_08180 [Halobellus salinus]SMP01257.1 hypothetical protein SAMN06265347_10189 [Halobellus salinus]